MKVLGVRVMGPHDEWPVTCNALTAITVIWFFGICLQLMAESTELVVYFLLYMVGTAVFIKVCKKAFRWIGQFIITEEAAAKPRNIRKFADQGWQLTIHFGMTLLELAILANNWSWIEGIDSDGVDHVWEPVDQRSDKLLNTFYLVQLSIWLTTAISHRFFEARHKDYFVMYSHHVATITLIAWSWSIGALRIGFLVLLVHDSTDIMVDTLKITNYAGLDEKSGLYLVEASFVINLITWAVGRLYYYPVTIVGNTATHFLKLLGNGDAEHNDLRRMALFGCLYLLEFLVLLHCWWFFLLARMGVRLLMNERAHEIGSEEYEGSSDSEQSADEDDSKKSK